MFETLCKQKYEIVIIQSNTMKIFNQIHRIDGLSNPEARVMSVSSASLESLETSEATCVDNKRGYLLVVYSMDKELKVDKENGLLQKMC